MNVYHLSALRCVTPHPHITYTHMSQVLSDLSAPPAALALEQRLHHSISPGDTCRD